MRADSADLVRPDPLEVDNVHDCAHEVLHPGVLLVQERRKVQVGLVLVEKHRLDVNVLPVVSNMRSVLFRSFCHRLLTERTELKTYFTVSESSKTLFFIFGKRFPILRIGL